MFKLLVCGGRDFNDYEWLSAEVAELHPTFIISGGAKGADSLAERWANEHGVPITVIPADWGRYGRSAGPIRNQLMLDSYRPDMVLAFPGGTGTADMVRRTLAAGIVVRHALESVDEGGGQ